MLRSLKIGSAKWWLLMLLTSSLFATTAEQEEAYKDLESSLAPLSDDQMQSVKELYRKLNRQSVLRDDVAPTPTFSSLMVDLQPGSAPAAIRLAPGYVSSLLFVDSTGAPWPIRAYDVGDPSAFNIVWNNSDADESSLSNTLLIQAMSLYKDGNLVVMLQGLNTPVILSLIPGQQEVDYRVDLQIPGYGPFAKPEASTYATGANPVLNSVINNIAPPNSKPLRVKGGAAKAWLFGDLMYVRTDLPVVSPAWVSTMKGASGTVSAYELPKSPVILVMDNGRLRKLTVEGF
ncbi:DotH/IcmK family type IV secretion protein [Candidatus Synchoanobacter obligatus]|uniref:DotH/IcmK family type IV secretion protein n=1 Tax=Candidatus Synchoanobacter obligatus TaxID=2919597 RepID=A0ABT1L5C1_9GAMM|nr:DotH/IcmK family type IV secretion protein [Candidatus Synchoanobacter obligatus]MCP8352374.1 DotH/IcmK family type IV secretion protein [Candidatus Synchoanobacter obligatus]